MVVEGSIATRQLTHASKAFPLELVHIQAFVTQLYIKCVMDRTEC